MKRLVMMAVAAGAAMAAMAMPTRQQLAKAQEMVSDVTAADVAALKVGTKKPAEVAAKHMELAAQAGSEAEKYLLLQGAFRLYVKGEDYDNAAKAIETMQTEIKDFNPEVIVELCGKALVRKMQENAPRLYAIKENARRIVFYRKQLPIREAAVRKNPRDPQTQRRLAECHAELGDWPKALGVFVKAGGEFKKMAEGETSGKVPAQELGDFWWDYETKSDTFVYKLHAAELYRKALADESFKGLARTRTEQRLAEIEKSAVEVVRIVAKSNLSVRELTLGSDVKLCFRPCPCGTFTMGWPEEELHGHQFAESVFRQCEVRFDKPFWMAEVLVSERVWAAVMDEKSDSNNPKNELYSLVEDFFRKLKEKVSKQIPPGYDVRLPTYAEYEYALKAGGKEKDSPFARFQPSGEGAAVIRQPRDANVMTPKPNVWNLRGLRLVDGAMWIDDHFPDARGGLNQTDWQFDWGKFGSGSKRVTRIDRLKSLVNPRIPNPEGSVRPMFVADRGSLALYALQGAAWRRRKGYIRIVIAPKQALSSAPSEPEDCYPSKDFGGELVTTKYAIVEIASQMTADKYKDNLFSLKKPKSVMDLAFEVGAKDKEAFFTLKLPEDVSLAGLVVVNRQFAANCSARQVPLCVWVSQDLIKWERIFIDESVRDEYRIDLSNKNITCKYLRFGRLPGVNNEPFHLARTLLYAKPSAAGKKAEATGPVACYPREDFGGVLLSSKYEIVESSGELRFQNYRDGLFNCQKPGSSVMDFAFEVCAKEKEVSFTLKLSEPVTLAGLLIVNRKVNRKAFPASQRQVPLCVWASEDRTKWERIFIDESVRDEYRIDLSNKNITCKYLRFGRLPGVNNEPFHLARTLVYVKSSAAEKKAKK